MADKPIKDAVKELKDLTGGYKPIATPKDATGMQGAGITGTDRNIAKEIEAAKLGYSAEYIASRGGLNSQGYYNDVPLSGQLTADEQKSVRNSDGTTNTQAMATILQNKQIAELIAKGVSKEEATSQVSKQYGQYGIGGSSGFTGAGGGSTTTTASGATIATGGYDQQGNPVTGGQYDVNGNYVGINLTGGTSASATGTLAVDTFKATLGLFVGEKEMTKPWVTQLYKATSKFYKSGSTVEESFNMAIQDVQNNPDMQEFTKRFKGIYDLTAKRQQGQAVYVPTVAEYFATEKTMGDVLRQSNLGELANEDFLGGIIGKAVSATEFANRIQTVFDKIDYAPAAVKKTMQEVMPYADRSSLAKALLTGEQGAKELQNKIAGIEVLAAAQQQGLGATTLASATDLANQGYGYQQALSGYQQVANIIPTAQKLTAIEGGPAYTQQQAENVVFGKSAQEELALSQLGAREQARYRGSSGLSSNALASANRGY
jgi:hypothetical protein